MRVRQRPLAFDERDGVGSCRHLLGEQFHGGAVGDLFAGGVPAVQLRVQFVGVEQVEFTNRRQTCLRERVQDPDQSIGQHLCAVVRHQGRQVLQLERQIWIRLCQKRCRVVRRVVDLCARDRHAVDVRLRVELAAVHRVRLEDGERVEQDRQPRRTLDRGQPDMVRVEEACLFGLDPFEEPEDGLPLVEPDPHGDGVDEQSEYRLDARDLGRSARDRGTEHDVVTAQGARQHQTPCGLHQGVHRDAAVSREIREPFSGPMTEVQPQLDGDLISGALHGRLIDQQSRRVEAVEGVLPRSDGRGHVAPVQPGQEVAVRAVAGQVGVVAAGGVQREQLFHQKRSGPPVQQDVVVGERHPVTRGPVGIRGDAQEQRAHQRRSGHVEPVAAVSPQQPVDLVVGGSAVGPVIVGEIDELPGDVDAAGDHLDNRAIADVPESCAQVGVSSHESRHRRTKALFVDGPAQLEDNLCGVDVRDVLTGDLGVEEHADLQRRERPDIVHDGVIALEFLDLVLADPDQRDVGRSQSAGPSTALVGGERGRRRHPEFGEFLHIVVAEDLPRVTEGGRQPGTVGVVGGDRVDAQDRRHHHAWILCARNRSPTIGGSLPPVGVCDRVRVVLPGADAAEVVEADLGTLVARERGNRTRATVSEDAESDAVAGHHEQLLLDGLEGRARSRATGERVALVDAGEVEGHRVQTGEPADRPRQVGSTDGLFFAPMAFQIDEQRVRVDPPTRAPLPHSQS